MVTENGVLLPGARAPALPDATSVNGTSSVPEIQPSAALRVSSRWSPLTETWTTGLSRVADPMLVIVPVTVTACPADETAGRLAPRLIRAVDDLGAAVAAAEGAAAAGDIPAVTPAANSPSRSASRAAPRASG